MKHKKIKDLGPYVVDTKNRGCYTDRTEGIVMDNTISRIPGHDNKPKIVYFITENSKLLEGNNTVALFKIKQRHT